MADEAERVIITSDQRNTLDLKIQRRKEALRGWRYLWKCLYLYRNRRLLGQVGLVAG